MKYWPILLLLVSGCPRTNHTDSTTEPSPAVASSACSGEQGIACFEERRKACSPETTVWQYTEESLLGQSTLWISETGLVRRDFKGTTVFSADATHWLACIKDCQGTTSACVPYKGGPPSLWTNSADCDFSEEEGPFTDGMKTNTRTWECTGTKLAYSTELNELRNAWFFVQADPNSYMSDLNGFVTELGNQSMSVFRRHSFRTANCSAFQYPPAAVIFGLPKHFDLLESILPPLLENESDAETEFIKKSLASNQRSTQEKIKNKLGQLCLGERQHYSDDEVQTCIANHPELNQQSELLRQHILKCASGQPDTMAECLADNPPLGPIAKIILGSAASSVDAMNVPPTVRRTTVDLPLCQHYLNLE